MPSARRLDASDPDLDSATRLQRDTGGEQSSSMSNVNNLSISPGRASATRSPLATRPISAAALDEGQRMAAEAAVLIAEGPLRRATASSTNWTRTSGTDLELLRRLQDVDVDVLRRRRLLRSRREELERAQAWSQHVVLNKRRSATPLDAEQQALACGAAILMLGRLARSTSDHVPRKVVARVESLSEGAILPLTHLERFAAELILTGRTLGEARELIALIED